MSSLKFISIFAMLMMNFSASGFDIVRCNLDCRATLPPQSGPGAGTAETTELTRHINMIVGGFGNSDALGGEMGGCVSTQSSWRRENSLEWTDFCESASDCLNRCPNLVSPAKARQAADSCSSLNSTVDAVTLNFEFHAFVSCAYKSISRRLWGRTPTVEEWASFRVAEKRAAEAGTAGLETETAASRGGECVRVSGTIPPTGPQTIHDPYLEEALPPWFKKMQTRGYGQPEERGTLTYTPFLLQVGWVAGHNTPSPEASGQFYRDIDLLATEFYSNALPTAAKGRELLLRPDGLRYLEDLQRLMALYGGVIGQKGRSDVYSSAEFGSDSISLQRRGWMEMAWIFLKTIVDRPTLVSEFSEYNIQSVRAVNIVLSQFLRENQCNEANYAGYKRLLKFLLSIEI